MRRGHLDRNILFLCEDNSCLSQMAEAAAKHLAPPRTRIFSAGVKPSSIPPHVIQAMQELGISMDDKQKADAKGGAVLHIPTVAGATAVVINLPGIKSGQLKLTPVVLADIYLKKITNWNDKRIAAVNTGVKLPDLTIAVVHRSDGSGTTFIFTNYLSKVSSEWKDKVGSSTSVNWPGDVGGKGNEGVANSVKQIPGAIGYVEVAYAKQTKIPWVQLQNKAKKFLEPTLEGAEAAADVSSLPDNMEIVITNSSNANAYPITGFTWLLVYENQTDAGKGDAVAQLASWCPLISLERRSTVFAASSRESSAPVSLLLPPMAGCSGTQLRFLSTWKIMARVRKFSRRCGPGREPRFAIAQRLDTACCIAHSIKPDPIRIALSVWPCR